MSKLYEKYIELKKIDSKKMILFKSGNFYIFLDEDAKSINKVTTLKLTNLNNEIIKCGFPSNSLNKYVSILENLKINFKIINDVEEKNNKDKIVKMLKKIDINNITPLKAIIILQNLKELADE